MNAYERSEWLRAQLEYRLPASFCEVDHFILDESALTAMLSLMDLCVFDAGRREFLQVNGFDQMICMSSELAAFQVTKPKKNRPALGYRQAEFANLLMAMRMDGVFVSNWCDAQGWDYGTCLPDLANVPIIQYCRRREQRSQICLMPLGFDYMGPGGKNLPLVVDSVPFKEKSNKICWRGRFSGTVSNWLDGGWWAESILKRGYKLGPVDRENIDKNSRLRVVKALKDMPWADVKLSFSVQEVESIENDKFLKELFFECGGRRLPMTEQRMAKFLLVIDGNDIGTNKYWSLLSNSVVLMVESEWETALDAGLQPYKHFVPVKSDMESIKAAIDLMLSDESRCLEMIANAHSLLMPQLDVGLREAADHLTLKEYSSRVVCPFGGSPRWSFARSQKSMSK